MLLVSKARNDCKWGACISDNIKVTNGLRQGCILSPQLFNIYIDGLSNILNISSIGGSIRGKRINHILYADDLCIVRLSSAGLQQLRSICDQYSAKHSITLNVKKSVCMFFIICSIKKTSDITNVVLSSNIIDYVHKTKYLGVLLFSDMKTYIDISMDKDDNDDIDKIFSDKYMELYNSVPYDESEMKSIQSSILSRILNSSCGDYIIAVTDVRKGKSDSSEGLFSDHFIYGTRFYVILSILFTSMLSHGFSPNFMILGTMIPIPKDKKKS